MKKILEAVIIEDEYESLNLLQNLINENGSAKVAGTTSDPMNAVKLILSLKPDIVFLDISMPGKNGFEVLDDLRNAVTVQPYVVFTTAYDEYAIKAFEYAAFDYLLKPVEPKRLNDTIIRCLERTAVDKTPEPPVIPDSFKKLLFRSLSGIVIIDPGEVVYIEADGNYSVLHMSDSKTETVTSLLHKVEAQIEDERFFRISRSAVINTMYLKKINTRQMQCILSKNNTEFRIEISREKIRDLIKKIKIR